MSGYHEKRKLLCAPRVNKGCGTAIKAREALKHRGSIVSRRAKQLFYMSSTERVFYDHWKRRGVKLLYQPHSFDLGTPSKSGKHNKTYTPDFMNVSDYTYYEVYSTINAKRSKGKTNSIDRFKELYPNVKFEIVWPDGDRIED